MFPNATKIVLAALLVLLTACASVNRDPVRHRVLLKQQLLVDNFEFGVDAVPDAHREDVVRMAQRIKDMGPYAIIYLIGNTDNIGPERGNIGLSYQRAHNVADILVHEGIARDRIILFAEGYYEPAEPNDNAENRAHNRRVEIEIRCFYY